MGIDVNAIDQTVVVTAVGDEVNVNVIDQPVLVSVTDQIIEVAASGGTGPQGPAGAGVASGGTTGQVLSKASNTNYDTVWVDAGAGTVYSVDASGSTGISVTGGPITGAGTLTITNTAPDQVVGLTGAGTAVITGTYPNFTITTNDEFDGTVTSVNLTAGTGISVSGGPIVSSGSINVVNTAPDQVVSLTGGGTTTITGTYPNFTITSSDSKVGTVTSVDMTVPTGLTISGNPITSAGTLALALASGYSIPTTANQANWTTAYNDSITSASVSGTSTKTLTLNQQDGGTITASWSDADTGLTSVGLSMPVAFSVANTPLTSNGTLAVSAAGTSAQYIRGDGQLANFPSTGGGGSAYNYYLNGSVSQGTFGGVTYYEMSKSPILGTGTNFTRTAAQGNGYIASFITDANDPSLLSIPGGNWNLEFYFSASSGGGGPQFYAELYKVDTSNNFTLVASGSTNPEGIDNGTIVDQYFTSISVPLTSLALTDRLAVRIYVIPDGRNITLHTENSNLCEILTTFSTGLNALNGLTAQVQYFATGTSGTDFAISSSTDTHTFNLPTASATNRGALSSSDWSTFNGKENVLTFSSPLLRSVNTVSIPVANTSQSGYLSSTDWNTFNGKQPALNGTGFVKISGTTISYDNSTYYLASNPSAYIPLTALSAGAGISYNNTTGLIASTITQYTNADARLAISETVTGLDYDNTTGVFSLTTGYVIPTTSSATNWDAAYNDKINSASVTGTTTKTLTLNQQDGGTITASWTDINTDAVASVFGRTGAVIATSGDYTTTLVTEGTNLYYTDVRVSANSDVAANTAARHNAVTLGTANGLSLSTQQLSLALASSSATGALSSTDWTTFNSKQTALNGTGFVKISGTTISYDNSTYYLASNPSAYIALTALSASSPLSYNNTTGAFTIAQASGSANGYLSSTDWTTFNNKQNALTNPVTGTGTTNYLPKWTSGSALGNSVLQENSGSIGINGAAVPDLGDTRLQINATTYSSLSLKSTSVNALFRSHEPNGILYVGNISNHPIGFLVNDAEQMRLTSTGLGIGTTTPAGKLTVAESVNSGTANVLYLSNPSQTGVTAAAINFINADSFVKASIVAAVYGNDYMTFNVGSNTERMRINASGNLGLGVVPSAWDSGIKAFEIFSSGNAILSSTSSQNIITANARYVGGGWQYGSNGLASRYQQQSGVHSWHTAPSGTAGNAISFTQAMTLTAGGDLGIANTSPSYRVDIEGSSGSISTVRIKNGNTGGSDGSQILLGNSANFTNAYFRLNGGGNSSQGGVGSLNIGLTESAAMTFLTANTERLRITSGGNVLIGNTTGTELLSVQGNVASITQNNSSNVGFIFYAGSTAKYIWQYQYTDNALRLYDYASGERMRITSTGSVGIGTSSPLYKLDVNGGIYGKGLTADSDGGVGNALYAYNQVLSGSSTNALIQLETTWNTTGNADAIVLNVTNTASGASSRLLDLKVGGSSIFKVQRNGRINASSLPTSSAGLSSGDIWNDGGTLKIV